MNGLPRDAIALLEDMLGEARYLDEVTSTRDREEIQTDPTLRRGLERSLEILGEAAKAVPEDVQQRWPDLPWSQMARTRDLVSHAYHRVEPAIVWRTAEKHAAPLVEPLEEAVEAERDRAGSV